MTTEHFRDGHIVKPSIHQVIVRTNNAKNRRRAGFDKAPGLIHL